MKYLLDSDFLFGLAVENDPHHKTSKRLYSNFKRGNVELLVLNLVVQETATVISKKRSQEESIKFLDLFRDLPVQLILLDLELEKNSWKIFEKQTKKGTSFIDCANLATLEKYKLDGILSFDEFYPKEVSYQRLIDLRDPLGGL